MDTRTATIPDQARVAPKMIDDQARYLRWREVVTRPMWVLDRHWYVLLGILAKGCAIKPQNDWEESFSTYRRWMSAVPAQSPSITVIQEWCAAAAAFPVIHDNSDSPAPRLSVWR